MSPLRSALLAALVFLMSASASAAFRLRCIDGHDGVLFRGRCLTGVCDVDGKRDGACTFSLFSSACCIPGSMLECACPLNDRIEVVVPVGQRKVVRLPSGFWRLRCALHAPMCSSRPPY